MTLYTFAKSLLVFGNFEYLCNYTKTIIHCNWSREMSGYKCLLMGHFLPNGLFRSATFVSLSKDYKSFYLGMSAEILPEKNHIFHCEI